MQEKKRRSKRGFLLLVSVVALAVMAFVPASALALARTSVLNLDGATGQNIGAAHPSSVSANGWFGPLYTPTTIGHVEGVFTTDPALVATVTASFSYKIDGAATFLDGTTIGPITFPTLTLARDFGLQSLWSEGIHSVTHWTTETTPTANDNGALTIDAFGVDRTVPTWTYAGSGFGDGVYRSTDVNFTTTTTDPNGSGVEPTPTVTGASVANTETVRGATGDARYMYDGVGIATAPTLGDATASTRTIVTMSATDMVLNTASPTQTILWDVLDPVSGFITIPVGASNPASPGSYSFWTDTDVTVAFTASDPLANDTLSQSGVDYVQWVTKTMAVGDTIEPTAPLKSDFTTGFKAPDVPCVITDTAPQGPVFLFYRAVDSAVPANGEAWKMVKIQIDKNEPVLGNDVPDWWIDDSGSSRAGGNHEHFYPILTAADPNSGVLASSWMWDMPTWSNWTGGIPTPVGPYVDPQLYPDNPVDLYLDKATHETDGMFQLNHTASDNVKNPLTGLGNVATQEATVMIDTRAPVTDGEAGYGESPRWINGNVPYVLTATDEAPGAGVAATVYRLDQATAWSTHAATTVGTQLDTAVTISGAQGSVHQIDFGSLDAALPYSFDEADIPVNASGVPSYNSGNSEFTSWVVSGGSEGQPNWSSVVGYKTVSVKLDNTAPVVMLASPVNPDWQQGPAVINFTGTDVGSGYDYTEWSTDGGATWSRGDSAEIGGNGVITVHYRGVDNVGIKSATQTTSVSVATTGPTNAAKSATVVKGKKATFKFKVTAVTPQASVNILIRDRLSGRTLMMKRFSMVTTNSWVSRAFKVNLPKGKYFIRIDSVDLAGNTQNVRGQANLTVK